MMTRVFFGNLFLTSFRKLIPDLEMQGQEKMKGQNQLRTAFKFDLV